MFAQVHAQVLVARVLYRLPVYVCNFLEILGGWVGRLRVFSQESSVCAQAFTPDANRKSDARSRTRCSIIFKEQHPIFFLTVFPFFFPVDWIGLFLDATYTQVTAHIRYI